MTLVIDASALACVLIATDDEARWAESTIEHEQLIAPHQIYAEVANVIRHSALAGETSHDDAAAAHRDLVSMPLSLCAYEPFADRIWQLRESVTVYDAWCVAIAEHFDVPLVSLDRRLARAPGPRCTVLVPPTR